VRHLAQFRSALPLARPRHLAQQDRAFSFPLVPLGRDFFVMANNPWDEVGGIPSYLRLPVTDAHYHALGHAVAMWASVEIQTQHLLWALLGLDREVGRLLTATLRYDTHLAILKVVTATSKLTQEVSDIIIEAKRLKEARDTIVHSAWIPGDDLLNPKRHTLRMKGNASEPYSPCEIERIALEINALLRRLLQLHLAILYP
jgi:hypothetical protein